MFISRMVLLFFISLISAWTKNEI